MDANRVMAYVESGLGIRPEPKQFRKIAVGPFLMVMVMGMIPGVVLGGFWLFLALMMIATSLALAVVVFVLSSKKLTVMNGLIMQALNASNYVLQIGLLQTMWYTMSFGFDWVLVLLYLIPILTLLGMGWRNAKALRSNRTFPYKSNMRFVCGFGWTGAVGVCIAKAIFQDISQKTALVIVILGFALLSCVFSIGLLAYQRIFYLKKYF